MSNIYEKPLSRLSATPRVSGARAKPVLLALSALSLIFSLQAIASGPQVGDQRGGGPSFHPHGPPPMSRLLDRLGLEGKQRDQVRAILRQQRDQIHSIHSEAADKVDKETAAVKVETRAQLADVLSEEQLAKLDQMKTRKHRAERRQFPTGSRQLKQPTQPVN